ncbi:MAG: hypothetical protein Q4G42_04310 [Neisseria sp.]|nr:hypothetical protein [Neisseria sp.]
MNKRFNLPADFYNVKYYADGSATVRLVNPYTKRQGLFIDVEPRALGSQLRLYANYGTMSTAWRTLPEKCR